MAGIDTITSEILQEAEQLAQEILAEAKEEATKVAEDSAQELSQIAADAKAECLSIQKAGESRVASRRQMLSRQGVLRQKQKTIASVIDQAYEELLAQDDKAYWQMVETLLEAHLHEGEGRICFSQADVDRMPAEVKDVIAQKAQKADAKLQIAVDDSVEHGFLLDFGGIDENCSLKAIFAERREEMQDAVQKILWQE